MKVVILCAGKGSRLRPLTDEVPKGLIKVGNKTILERCLDNLNKINVLNSFEEIEEVILVVGYKKELIQNYFKNKYKSLSLKYVIQKEQNGTGGAVLVAKDYLDSKFLVLNGDDIYSIEDLKKLLNEEFGVLGTQVDEPQNFGIYKHDEEFNLEEIVEKPQTFISNFANIGAYLVDKSIFECDINVSSRGEIEITDMVNQFSRKNKVKIIKIKDLWLPVNSYEQLEFARKFFKKNCYAMIL